MPYRATLRLRAGLSKAQSSILTQMRTGKIGLAAFPLQATSPRLPDAGLLLRSAVGDCQARCFRVPHACSEYAAVYTLRLLLLTTR